ncbi:hypothetical protein Tco_0809165, partial [Tanacetum coccineum]
VADTMLNGAWKWPTPWFDHVPALNRIVAHVLIHDRQDKVCWRTQDGNLKNFSVGLAWESIRAWRDNVPWFHVV